MNNAENQVIITVSGKDKVGIVASVSNCLSKYNVFQFIFLKTTIF